MHEDTLSGFGAALANWNRHHTADGKLGYLPKVRVAGQDFDTWSLVNAQLGYVQGYQRLFPSGTTAQQAINDLSSQDLPDDAREARSSIGNTCREMTFRSETLARMVPGLRSDQISVALYTASTKPYRADDVTTAILGFGSGC